MIPFDCTHLERLGDNQPTIFADTSCVLNELDLQSLINYCIALKEEFQRRISLLGFCNFLFFRGYISSSSLQFCKHFIHVKAIGLRWHAGCIVATPMVRK
jgi:hypothetical protein